MPGASAEVLRESPQLLFGFCVAPPGVVISSPQDLEVMNQGLPVWVLTFEDSDQQGHPLLTLGKETL